MPRRSCNYLRPESTAGLNHTLDDDSAGTDHRIDRIVVSESRICLGVLVQIKSAVSMLTLTFQKLRSPQIPARLDTLNARRKLDNRSDPRPCR